MSGPHAATDTSSATSDAQAQFIAGLRTRDERALARLFAEHSRHVERVLMRVLGPDPELSDIAQDAFEQAILSVHRFRGESSSVRAWLTRIALNVARNKIRYRRVRGWLGSATPIDRAEVTSRVASPEVALAMRRTYEAFDRLPADQRIVFALRTIDGMRVHEIAEATGTSRATVKRRLAKARARFERIAAGDPLLRTWLAGGGS